MQVMPHGAPKETYPYAVSSSGVKRLMALTFDPESSGAEEGRLWEEKDVSPFPLIIYYLTV